jgi:hypothetical protein
MRRSDRNEDGAEESTAAEQKFAPQTRVVRKVLGQVRKASQNLDYDVWRHDISRQTRPSLHSGPACGQLHLHCPAAHVAKSCSRGRKRAALAAKPPRAHRNHSDGNVSLLGAGPDQRHEPADDCPPEKQVQDENAHGIWTVPPNNGGKEIQENRENQESHHFTPFRTSWSWRDTSAGPYLKVRGNSQDCSRHSRPLQRLGDHAPALWTLASNSTNFCLRSA